MLWQTSNFQLPTWAGQLAGILPLSALIEFIDIGSKLHTAQLTGSIPIWQWAITPAGACLLFAVKPSEIECALDHPERSSILECFDTRHGDAYPSSTPTTTRLWTAAVASTIMIDNAHLDKAHPGVRPQVLQLFRMRKDGSKSASVESLGMSKSTRILVLQILGWILWLALAILSILSGLWPALAHLISVSVTGCVIGNTHGRSPRHPLNLDQLGKHDRLIVATSSRNSLEWTAFYGESVLLNGLLNRPLLRRRPTLWPRVSITLLQVVILCQWVAVLAASSLADWNAYVVSFWIFFCSISSAYAHTPVRAARDWLKHHCGVSVEEVQVEFSSRRAMLGALVYLSPDRTGPRGPRTSWMDSILSKSSTDRSEWEAALLEAIEADGAPEGSETKGAVVSRQGAPAYWSSWVVESVEIGRKLKHELREL